MSWVGRPSPGASVEPVVERVRIILDGQVVQTPGGEYWCRICDATDKDDGYGPFSHRGICGELLEAVKGGRE